MKRYWLFCFNNCYPLGGMQDFWKDFDTINECQNEYDAQEKSEYQIFDSKQKVVLFDNMPPDEDDVHQPKLDCLGDPMPQLSTHLKHIYPENFYGHDG